MLIYESDGFLEAEVDDISQLCRSKQAVSFGDGDFDLQAVLCEYQENNARRCRAAFYARSLKRSLVFTVSDGEKKTAWQHGQDVLAELGFELEAVNLKLSPAMLEVVLRDVPGLSTPAKARTLRTEQMQDHAEWQKCLDDNPESAQGKKAALKLNALKRSEEKLEGLRQQLEAVLSPQDQGNEELETLLAQVKDLTSRLEESEKLAEQERTQREFNESVAAAAEKRIRELEEVLVDVETKSSDELKLKRKIVSLQSQAVELENELRQTQEEMKSEREKQDQFVDDVKSSQATISSLEASLKEKDKALDGAQEQLEEGLAEREELETELKEARLRIKVLSKDLESKAQVEAQGEETSKEVRQLEEELAEAQQALLDSQQENKALLEQQGAADSEGLDKLQAQYDELALECQDVKEQLEQETSVRRRLERGAAADDKKISELEEALAEQQQADAAAADAAESSTELAELQARFAKEQDLRQDLEAELEEAHKIVDSLEQMIREREDGSGGKQAQAEQEGMLEDLRTQAQQMETQLEQEQIEQKKLAKSLAASEQKAQALQEEVQRLSAELEEQDTSAKKAKPLPEEKRKLPHELRPAPKKGAFYRPDWDLAGLPCKSSSDVLQAWETVSNVQISIEGYPAQYCMAFLVVVRQGKQKRACLLYRLKTDKHTLVCVPAKQPKDEKSLKKAINEGLTFLKKSGFQMEKMAAEHVDGALKSYFSG